MDVAYEQIGSGPPVLLVAGLSQPGARWRRVADRLAKPAPGHPLGGDPRTFTVITADNRETGGTGPSPAEFTLADIAGDLLALMTRLGHQRFLLGGISMGGMIAQEIVRAAPERVRGCVLLATHGGHAQSVLPDPSVLTVSSAHELWTNLSGPGFAAAHPDVIDEEARLSVEAATPLDGTMRQLQAVFAYEMGDSLAGLAQRMPLAVGHGDHDPLVPYENGVRLAAQLGVELVTYRGAGHGLEFERPDEVVALMRQTFAAAG